MKTLNVIGCGNVGKTLCRLWTQCGVFHVEAVLNRSMASSRRAVEFVGAGRPIENYAQFGRADAVMISTSDEAIETCCRRLAETDVLSSAVVALHCSGSLASTILEPARRRGAAVASLHPVKSFANPALSAETFEGTFCAVEGDAAARALLEDAVARLGAKTFRVDPEFKTIYHAATVIVSNYQVALAEVGLRCFEKAGIDRATAAEVIGPIVNRTLENVLALGPVHALTGPIARGEPSVVARQCEALGRWDALIQNVYRSLGRVAVELSAAQGNADPDALAAIQKALDNTGTTQQEPGTVK